MDSRIDYKDLGICIINTDRVTCLTRLMTSIIKNTDQNILQEIKINIIDDSLNPKFIQDVIEQLPFVNFIHTGERIGIAKNTNFALDTVKSKEYVILFNNDCEILKTGWIEFYYNASIQTQIHHFCFQQEGLWGAGTSARPETRSTINGIQIKTIHDFPQGAILAFDNLAFRTVGYFDSKSYKGYGKSHWDWSFRISESGIQPKGIHDVIGSNQYFKVHNEKSVTEESKRIGDYKRNTELYKKLINDVRNHKRQVFMEFKDV